MKLPFKISGGLALATSNSGRTFRLFMIETVKILWLQLKRHNYLNCTDSYHFISPLYLRNYMKAVLIFHLI